MTQHENESLGKRYASSNAKALAKASARCPIYSALLVREDLIGDNGHRECNFR